MAGEHTVGTVVLQGSLARGESDFSQMRLRATESAVEYKPTGAKPIEQILGFCSVLAAQGVQVQIPFVVRTPSETGVSAARVLAPLRSSLLGVGMMVPDLQFVGYANGKVDARDAFYYSAVLGKQFYIPDAIHTCTPHANTFHSGVIIAAPNGPTKLFSVRLRENSADSLLLFLQNSRAMQELHYENSRCWWHFLELHAGKWDSRDYVLKHEYRKG